MLSVLVIVLVMMALGGALWVAQAHRALDFAATQVAGAWEVLRAELAVRREMVPYIVAMVPSNIAPLLDVLGNACDLAANVTAVRDCSQAEARLSAAISRLLSQLDMETPAETREMLRPLRSRLKEQEMKIDMLKELYNHQVDMFNVLLKQGGARILVSFGAIKPQELF